MCGSMNDHNNCNYNDKINKVDPYNIPTLLYAGYYTALTLNCFYINICTRII